MEQHTHKIEQQIESILFWKSAPVSVKELSRMLSVATDVIIEHIPVLEKSLENRGIVLIKNSGDTKPENMEVFLATSPESSELIKKISMEEESAELGKASLETLSIILYKGPIRRSDVDYIRGVNSSFIIRNLLVRGLIEKKSDPKDSRTFLYSASFDLLAHLGVSELSKLPDFEKVQIELQNFKEQKEQGANNNLSSQN
ncbi:MAG: SMC-Scp complex subunit ScpB [bacterium]